MESRNFIHFRLNDEDVVLDAVAPDDTLLDYLRLNRSLKGTKEGCAEGDCGACTVLIGKLNAGQLEYQAINACIRFLGSLDGTHVVTIEHLRGPDGGLHPIQQAMVQFHGSQCGFCTPGFVMALYAWWMRANKFSALDVEVALQGNLCRCTGYESILRSALAASENGGASQDALAVERDRVTDTIKAMRDGKRVELASSAGRLIIPANVDDLAAVLQQWPNATIVSGATDVGLWVTKQLRKLSTVIFIGNLEELRTISKDNEVLTIGASVTYSEALPVLSKEIPAFGALFYRIGGAQVRNMGTIGGNIANGSPIGDTPPALIALDAAVTLRRGDQRRRIRLEDFFISYGCQDRHSDEFIEAIHIPLPKPNAKFAVYKVSKRRDEDITTTLGAFHVSLNDKNEISAARIAYGGMAEIPKRAASVEARLIGNAWTEQVVNEAVAAYEQDFTPLSDMRASAEYRMLVAKNLLRRFFVENSASAEGFAQ